MKLLYFKKLTWEYDYIIKDVLYSIKDIEIEIFEEQNFLLLLERTDIIENNILVINDWLNINNIINVVKKIKPIIIIHLSDEAGNNSEIMSLEKHAKILFRQYNHKHYAYSNNNYQIPLGYSTNFLNSNSLSVEIKKMREREINASFIGHMKTDRLQMSNVFKENMTKTKIIFVENNWNIDNLPYSPKECFNIYNNSIFVITGRGWKVLDCFRIYEAIVAGAVPVLVGPIEEIENSFYYNNNMPPIIYDETWEKVVIKCNDLLNNYDKLEEKQAELLNWWRNQMIFINNLITQL